MSRVLRWALWGVGAGVALLAALLALVAAVLRPGAGEWAVRLPVGVAVSGPGLLRVATHPIVLRATAGRTWRTPFGPVRWHADGDAWVAECAPCSVARPEWGREPVAVARLTAGFQPRMGDRADGALVVGDGPEAVRGRWSAALARDGVAMSARFDDVPIADAYTALAAVVPERRRARIAGRLDLHLGWQWPSGRLTVRHDLRGFHVDGLGTDGLVHARPSCGEPAPAGFGRWLPRAVLAAEDQRFHEHAGVDLDALAAAWSANQAHGTVVAGGSTLSQQLAKLLFTGEGRSPARKLRELLYAVELDRTLGKARVLQLYLSIAPWGEGLCGAAAAARAYLHKDVAALTPIEAAWLASLLRNPDRDRQRQLRDGHVDTARVDWVMGQMRPLPPRRARVPAAEWRPPS